MATGLPASGATPRPGVDDVGSPGIGDPYFKGYGNGGYDVRHYDIRVGWFPGGQRLEGTTTVTAVTTQRLRRFNLDLQIKATSVRVDGEPADFSQSGRELVITPASELAAGERMTVRVRYAGQPGRLSVGNFGGWFRTDDGAVVLGEPVAATIWYPSNDHPRDKATFDIRVSTPAGMDAVSNGLRMSVRSAGSRHTAHWRVTSPMATYLAYLALGDFRFERGRTAAGTPYLYAISEHLGRVRRPAVTSLRATGRAVDVFEAEFGPYPFDITGGTLVNDDFGFALENQTRPVYSKLFFGRRNTNVIAHEIAHQWFGDSVSVNRWRDIWLNEGFATWASWLYATRVEREPLNRQFAGTYRGYRGIPAMWRVRIGDPGPRRLFHIAVYDRGAMAVQALRNKIGVADHRRLLRTWLRTHRDGDATVRQFRVLAEKVSGVELDRFFRVWLFSDRRPEPTRANGFPESMLR